MKMTRKSHHLFLTFFLLGILYFIFRLFYFDLKLVFNPKLIINFLILAPIVEEVLFRGIVQKELSKRIVSGVLHVSYANVLTSLCFSVVHLIGNNAVHSMLVFIPSLIFGSVFERYKSIYPSILLHAFYNLNVFIVPI